MDDADVVFHEEREKVMAEQPTGDFKCQRCGQYLNNCVCVKVPPFHYSLTGQEITPKVLENVLYEIKTVLEEIRDCLKNSQTAKTANFTKTD